MSSTQQATAVNDDRWWVVAKQLDRAVHPEAHGAAPPFRATSFPIPAGTVFSTLTIRALSWGVYDQFVESDGWVEMVERDDHGTVVSECKMRREDDGAPGAFTIAFPPTSIRPWTKPCPDCRGAGIVFADLRDPQVEAEDRAYAVCGRCEGSGEVLRDPRPEDPEPLPISTADFVGDMTVPETDVPF